MPEIEFFNQFSPFKVTSKITNVIEDLQFRRNFKVLILWIVPNRKFWVEPTGRLSQIRGLILLNPYKYNIYIRDSPTLIRYAQNSTKILDEDLKWTSKWLCRYTPAALRHGSGSPTLLPAQDIS